jgi:transcriptional regulator PpsR
MNTRESDFWNERAGPRIAPEHFGDIVATAADLAILLAPSGTVISITKNPLNSAIGSVAHWEGRRISEFLAPDSRGKVMDRLEAVGRGEGASREAFEVNHVDGATWDFPVRYTLHETGRDGRTLMLGRDMRPVVELQQRLVRAQAALERDYDAQRVFETRYRVLLEASPEALVLVDAGSGKTLDLNGAAARMLGGTTQSLTGTSFAAEFEGRRRAPFVEELVTAAADEAGTPVEAAARHDGTAVAITPTLFRNAGERVLLCRLGAANVVTGPGGGALRDRLAALFRGARDGIAFVNADGMVQHANEAFLSMLDMGGLSELRGRPMTDLLARGAADLKVMTEDAQVSAYATRLLTAYGAQVPVEISSTPLGEGPGWHGFVVRETGRSGMMREDAESLGLGGTGDAAMGNARALVGSAPLRDIVASMTDVIEKSCIEAAVELTSNNRVAAAEMLGLSRQSLYVKLRKYDLLRRGDED